MDIPQYLEKMKGTYEKLINFIDNQDENNSLLQDLVKIFNEKNVENDVNEFKFLLRLIKKISNNHQRTPYFFHRIEAILNLLKDNMKKQLTNGEIFHIFKSNKRILLFLIKEKILEIDIPILSIMVDNKYLNRKYIQYFSPEIKSLMEKSPPLLTNLESYQIKEISDTISEKLPQNFEEMREKGEDDRNLYASIRKDSVQEFLENLKNSEKSVNSEIIYSDRYETNLFILNNRNKMIEYAAINGSIQILQYLFSKGVDYDSSLLWLYAVHSNNLQIIQFLEKNNVKPRHDDYTKCIKESIKCHHNDLTNYLISTHLQNKDESSIFLTLNGLAYYNFEFIKDDKVDQRYFYAFCKYNYINIVQFLLKSEDINVNKTYI